MLTGALPESNLNARIARRLSGCPASRFGNIPIPVPAAAPRSPVRTAKQAPKIRIPPVQCPGTDTGCRYDAGNSCSPVFTQYQSLNYGRTLIRPDCERYPQRYPPLAGTCPQPGRRLIHRWLQTFHWANQTPLDRLLNRVERSGLAGNGGPKRSLNRKASSQGRGHLRLKWLKGDRSRASGAGPDLSGGKDSNRTSGSLRSVGRAKGRRRSKASQNNGSRSHGLRRRRRRSLSEAATRSGARRQPPGRLSTDRPHKRGKSRVCGESRKSSEGTPSKLNRI